MTTTFMQHLLVFMEKLLPGLGFLLQLLTDMSKQNLLIWSKCHIPSVTWLCTSYIPWIFSTFYLALHC